MFIRKSESENDKFRTAFWGERDSYDDLIDAVKQNNIDEAKKLLDAGAKTKILIGNWRCSYANPLHYAALANNLDMLKLLFTAEDADVNSGGGNNATPLHMATDPKVIDFLISKGAKINAQNCHGYTPLHFAVSNKDTEAAKTLIKHGADPFIESGGPQSESAYGWALGRYKNDEISGLMHGCKFKTYGARAR